MLKGTDLCVETETFIQEYFVTIPNVQKNNNSNNNCYYFIFIIIIICIQFQAWYDNFHGATQCSVFRLESCRRSQKQQI